MNTQEARIKTARRVGITVVLAIGFALLVSALSGCGAAKPARVAVPQAATPLISTQPTIRISDGTMGSLGGPVAIVNSPNVIPWPSEFAQVFDKMKDVRQRVDEIDKWRAQAAAGISDAIDWLRSQIPPGMTVDETRRSFVPAPPQAPAPAPSSAAPASTTPETK